MSKVFIEESTLTAIGNAIRAKDGSTALIAPLNMANAITNLPSGGGGGDGITVPSEVFILTGDLKNKFSSSSWNWFFEDYKDIITTVDISSLSNAFYGNQAVKTIPIVFNMSGYNNPLSSAFKDCFYLEEAPSIKNAQPTAISGLFDACWYLRTIPEDFGDDWNYESLHATGSYNAKDAVFSGAHSLRRIPTNFLKNLRSENSSYSSSAPNRAFQNCYVLDEIRDFGVSNQITAMTSNMFRNTFTSCSRIKEMTFETNEDGTPKSAKWKSQVIDLTGVGYNTSDYFTNKNSGLDTSTKVTDDATYQNCIQNHPDDWWSMDINYSRYNHDSAVNTLNSLPDTTATGTNTIKFTGAFGALTTGGAINTLTEEEIAVAAAKGWTVTLV